jgi:hypothetical protein
MLSNDYLFVCKGEFGVSDNELTDDDREIEWNVRCGCNTAGLVGLNYNNENVLAPHCLMR